MTGSDNIRRKEGVIGRDGFVEMSDSSRLPIDFSGGNSYPPGTRVSFHEKVVKGKTFAGGIREVHTEPTPYLAKNPS